MRSGIGTYWLFCHWISLFFEDFPSWLRETETISPILFGEPALPPLNEAAVMSEYDELFNGANADIYFPLWASAAVGNGTVLLDKTTLAVIRFYNEWGYASSDIGGNPPDHVGQQFRFLAYLWAGALHEKAQGRGIEKYEAAFERFCGMFLQDTVRAVVDGMRKFASSPLFLAAADAMSDFIAIVAGTDRHCAVVSDLGIEKDILAVLERSPWRGTFQDGRKTEAETKAPRVVNTSGRNNCGGKCVIRVTEREGCVIALGTETVSDVEYPDLPPLKACARGMFYNRTYLSGQRLRYPMKRAGARGEGRFKRISWEEAEDITASECIRIRETYGPGARYINYSTGVRAVLRPDNLARRLLALDGGYLGYYNSYSSACTGFITPYIYGDSCAGNSIEDLLNTKLLLLWGHNPSETMFGTERGYYLRKAREKGTRIVVIDPRRSDTALALADEWIGVRPSTDGALADAMAYVIWSEGLQDQRFMDNFCVGFDEGHMPEGVPQNLSYEAYLFGKTDGAPKTPAWASRITGVPEETITKLAVEYARTKPACLLPGLGPQRNGNGEQTTRSLAMLACLTGNVGISGGGAGGNGEFHTHSSFRFPMPENPFDGKIPCFLWTRAVEHASEMTRRGDGLEGADSLTSNIKMMLNLGGNALLNQHSDINNTIRILKDPGKCEFILCSDVFMTSSARFADILLPAASFFEDENIYTPWSGDGYLIYGGKALEPLFDCRFEYSFFRGVAARLGLESQWSMGLDGPSAWLEYMYKTLRSEETELPEFESFRQNGLFRYKKSKPAIAYERQIRDIKNNPFNTPSGKIEIFSKRIYRLDAPDEIPAIPRYVACPEGPEDNLKERYPLQLIGWHTKRSCHSIHFNNRDMDGIEPQRLWINPLDAEKRGISDTQEVEVFNDRGRLRIRAYVTDRIISGVTAMPEGAWYKPDASGVDTNGSINVLTSTRATPFAKGNPQHTNLVEVAPAI
jgi:anaerobic dimethyl sulfoxide reductase subunit A